MSVSKELLINAIENMFAQDKIGEDVKTDALAYIAELSEQSWLNVLQSQWNKTASVSWVFNDTNRTITNSSGLVKSLISNNLAISGFKLKGFKILGATEAVSFFYSLDGTNWVAVDSWNICETIDLATTSSFYIRIDSNDNVIARVSVFKELL